MSYPLRKFAVLLPCIIFVPDAAPAADEPVWETGVTRAWLNENVAVRRSRTTAPALYALNRTQAWASGVAPSGVSAFTSSDHGKTLGAKLQPFDDWNLRVGTELARSGGDERSLSSKALWETSWSRDLERLGGVQMGLATGGSVSNVQTDYLQSFSGSVNVPLDLPLNAWSTELRFVPSMNVDLSKGNVSSNLASELVGRRVLSSQNDAYTSTLNVKVGYSLAPDSRPSASARLELRISPNL